MTCPKRCPNGTTCNSKNKKSGQCVPKTKPKPTKKNLRKECIETEEECTKREIIHEVLKKVKKDTKVLAEDQELIKETTEKLESASKADMSWIKRQMQRADSLKLFLLQYRFYLLIVASFAAGFLNYYSKGKLFEWAGKIYFHSTRIPEKIKNEAIKEAVTQIEEQVIDSNLALLVTDAASQVKKIVTRKKDPIFTDKFLKTQYDILNSLRKKMYKKVDVTIVFKYIRDHNIMCTKFEEGAAVLDKIGDLITNYIKAPSRGKEHDEWFKKALKEAEMVLPSLSQSCGRN